MDNSIFKKASRTHYYSSVFFPKKTREDINILYTFLRTIDDLVDDYKYPWKEYKYFKKEYKNVLLGKSTNMVIICEFIKLARRKDIKEEWINSLFESMEMDINSKKYETIQDTLHYIYGVAEVVGLMVSKILDLEETAYSYAQLLGRSAQYINMIRDIKEDNSLNKIYFPYEDISLCGLKNLEYEHVKNQPEQFSKFINIQLSRYYMWIKEAENGFEYIPQKYLIGIKTLRDMYNWTAKKIEKNPYILYQIKVKPHKHRVLISAFKNFLLVK